jgi:hypothetical protein
VPYWECDECGAEEKLYFFDDKELCMECIERKLTRADEE